MVKMIPDLTEHTKNLYDLKEHTFEVTLVFVLQIEMHRERGD